MSKNMKKEFATFLAGIERTVIAEKQHLGLKRVEGKQPISVEAFKLIAKMEDAHVTQIEVLDDQNKDEVNESQENQHVRLRKYYEGTDFKHDTILWRFNTTTHQ